MATKAAFARAFKTLTAAVADVVGPSQWGLQETNSEVQTEASAVLESLFQVTYAECLVVPCTDSTHIDRRSRCLLAVAD